MRYINLRFTYLLTYLLTDLLCVERDLKLCSLTHSSCFGGAVVERWTRDRKVAGSTAGRGAIKSTRSTQPYIPPGYVN